MKTGKLILLVAALLTSGCGYRLAALKGNDGAGRTIAVPTFTNKSTGYRIEQEISEAVRKELARRTRYLVTSEPAGDVVVSGEVLSYNNTSPTVFNEQGRAAQYAIAVELKILVTDTASGKELFRNDQMTFRDSFQLSQNPADFVPEDPAAIDRVASRFASSLVAALLHNRP
jgi:outer membrane lipopolysaccharide assembly protein LptE/RlpB